MERDRSLLALLRRLDTIGVSSDEQDDVEPARAGCLMPIGDPAGVRRYSKMVWRWLLRIARVRKSEP